MTRDDAPRAPARPVSTDVFPVAIALLSLLLSTFNFYVGYLKAPDIDFVVAPYVSQIVDSQSGNEAFFIPLTVINRGARPGTVLSFELMVTRGPDMRRAEYFAQYYAQPSNAHLLGDFFTPLTLNGYSSLSQTVCFYPIGSRTGTFFSQVGDYLFQITAVIANVQTVSRKTVVQEFHLHLTSDMLARMQALSTTQYPYPIPVEATTP